MLATRLPTSPPDFDREDEDVINAFGCWLWAIRDVLHVRELDAFRESQFRVQALNLEILRFKAMLPKYRTVLTTIYFTNPRRVAAAAPKD